MKNLSISNANLLLQGANVCGTFDEGFSYIEEMVKIKDANELINFCKWIDKNIGGASRYNIQQLFLAYKNPKDAELQKFATDLAKRISEFKNR